ncbi:ABC transporter permease [Calidifontibacter sp. DB0510]|uniref:ABC transporter permease n=1 Tax=Metallococcus carri TaxID=1656884 RepID=A0A967E9T0_9MICO|nr:ABC transporter permease [Metallococcus carri]NHN56717.1 ABC transporter permease [Metallococcus carri]NOP37906.1 ABC transporter permease [Calidifontibacter sp. DB2511S]
MSSTPTTTAAPPAGPSKAALAEQRTVDRERRARRRAAAQRYGIRIASLVVVLLLWWLVTAAGWIKPLYLPSPGAVWDAFVRANSIHPVSEGSSRLVAGEQGYYLWQHLLASLQRMAIGVGCAILLAPLLGFLMATIKPIGLIVEPYLNFLRALPPLGYIGILIVWFGIGDLSKVWLLFLAAFPPITMATINGVRSVRADRINAVKSLGGNFLDVWRYVILPSTAPDILNGIRIAIGFAWTTVVAAELNAGNPGIGYLAYISGTELQTPLTIACIIVIGIAAILLDLLVKGIENLVVPWRGKA